MLSLGMLYVYGGIVDFSMSRIPIASERTGSNIHDLVGNIGPLWWYQRFQRVKNSSIPVRESTYKYHALDGNTVRLWWYQRLCYVENAFCR
jgi:hypothetical protein